MCGGCMLTSQDAIWEEEICDAIGEVGKGKTDATQGAS
jgi:hypothetical protein